jgi:hypothetical protein
MIFSNKITSKIAAFVAFIFLSSTITASTIKGKILDSKTMEPLTGALFFEKSNKNSLEQAKLDGTYSIKKLQPGKHTFVIQFIGYITQEKEIIIASNNDVVNVDVLLEPKNISLDQVEVTAHFNNESNQSARSAEKNADNLLNIISAKSIQLSPDLSVANVLQRVSGVTVQKTANSGEGQYAIIRGMDKRYNYTLVNGIKIPSPNDKNRYVPMDIFPAELIAHLDVIKALTPDLEGDAIGGAMNLVMKDAPDKLLVSVNGSVGYNQIFFDRPFYQFNSSVVQLQAPAERGIATAKPSDFTKDNLNFTAIKPLPNWNGGLSIGNRFFNKKLGVILSISNQNSNSGCDAFVAVPKTQPNLGTIPAFETREDRTYSTQQNRLGIHNKIDFEINNSNKISLYNAYFELNKYISRHLVETSIGTGNGNIVDKNRSQSQFERIYNSTLQGNHKLAKSLLLDWSAVYSKAWANYPDEVELQDNSTIIDSPTLQGLTHRWRHNTDQDIAGYINVTWNPEFQFLPKNTEIKVGAMLRHKVRNNYYNEYSLSPIPDAGADVQLYHNIYTANFEFNGGVSANGSPVNQNDYDVTENVGAYYGQLKFKIFSKLNVLAGARVEQTNLYWHTPMPNTFDLGNAGHPIYMDILPSVHLKYELTPNQNVRLSYFSSISRPGYFELVPYDFKGETFDEIGNPYLKRSKAQNIDLRYELFPRASEQILVGVFYKNINNPIEYSLVKVPARPSTLLLQPNNFGDAVNYGFELVIVKYLGDFGVSGNYTYTKSSITTDKYTYDRVNPSDPTSGIVTTKVSRTRPMQGQADNIANLSLLYKNQKIGLDFQLSMVYTGQYISQVSAYDGLDYWSMPNTTLDFSFEKKLSKKINLSIFGKARNLLNSAAIQRILKPNDYFSGNLKLPQQDSPNSVLVQKELYGQNFLLGFRYSL